MKTKKKKFQFLTLGILVISAVVFNSCWFNDDPKKHGFSSPEEFIENPSVKGAIKQSGIEINEGSTPPALAGDYLTDGRVIDASSLLRSLIGAPINTEIDLYNQTTSGKISLREKVSGITVSGNGGYITGSGGKFTIYIESKQSGSEAGLPDDLSLNVALLMSGTKLSNGDLSAVKGISIITEVYTSNKNYANMENSWWMWNADFDLQTGLRSAKDKSQASQSMKEIMQLVVSKLISN